MRERILVELEEKLRRVRNVLEKIDVGEIVKLIREDRESR